MAASDAMPPVPINDSIRLDITGLMMEGKYPAMSVLTMRSCSGKRHLRGVLGEYIHVYYES